MNGHPVLLTTTQIITSLTAAVIANELVPPIDKDDEKDNKDAQDSPQKKS